MNRLPEGTLTEGMKKDVVRWLSAPPVVGRRYRLYTGTPVGSLGSRMVVVEKLQYDLIFLKGFPYQGWRGYGEWQISELEWRANAIEGRIFCEDWP